MYMRAFIFFLCFFLAGCAAMEQSSRQAPAYRNVADHYRSFSDANELATYLRYSTTTGPLLVAHRGGRAIAYPENALATFDRALRFSPVIIECDIHMTSDEALIIIRDETLERTTTGRGLVLDHSLKNIRSLLLVDHLRVITPFKIPTLSEILAWSEERAILMLDIKNSAPLEKVVAMVDAYSAEGRVVFMAPSLQRAREIHKLNPHLSIGIIVQNVDDLEHVLTSSIPPSRLTVLSVDATVEPELIDLAHAHDMRIAVGTVGLVDERARNAGVSVYQALLDRGIDALLTDEVALASHAISPYQHRAQE